MVTGSTETANIIRFVAWPLVLLIVSLSLGLAIVLRRRYVATLLRLQRGASAWAAPLPPQCPPTPLSIEFENARVRDAWIPPPAETLRLRRRILFVEFLSALGFWYVFLGVSFFGVNFLHYLLRFWQLLPWLSDWRTSAFLCLYIFGPPIVFACTQAALDKKYTLIAVAAAALAFGFQVYSNASVTPLAVQAALLGGGLGAFAVILTMLQNPRLRGAVAPLVVAFTSSAVLWLSIVITIIAFVFDLQSLANDDGFTVSDLLFLAALVLIVVSAAAVLFGLAVLYEKKRYSDVELGQVAFWLLIALAAFGTGAFLNTGTLIDLSRQVAVLVACWFGYRVGRQLLLRWTIGAPRVAVGGLLVLRVFKTPARSEVFYTRLFSYWRFAAPVRMIAGADLAEANLEPDKFFALLRRRLANEFIRSVDQITPRVNALDERRDPDGRFRVTELFCVDETWRPTVESLIQKAGAILLDLRDYTSDRSGTRYEIHQLMSLVALDRLVVVVSERDDPSVISGALASAWAAMSDASPNRQIEMPALKVFRLSSGSMKEVRTLFARLTAASQVEVGPTQLCADDLGAIRGRQLVS